MKKIIILIILSMFIFSTCNVFEMVPKPPDYAGSLFINIDNDVNPPLRTITIPEGDLVADYYNITLTNLLTGSLPPDNNFIGPSYFKNGLTPGDWSVTVDAFDSTIGAVIASDTKSFTIVLNTATIVDIEVIPLTGTGTLNLDLTWPVSEISTPQILASLTPVGGIPATLNITPGAGSATYTDPTLAAGYYYLMMTLDDIATPDPPVWGLVEAVRIIEGLSSSAVWNLTVADFDVIDLQLNLGFDLQNPLNITFSGIEPVLYQSSTSPQIMTVNVDPDAAGYIYRWFLNGVEITVADNTLDTIVLNASSTELSAVGNYRLDVLVNDGGILSSGNFIFTVNL